MNIEFELTFTPITSTVRLAFIGEQLREKKIRRHLDLVCPSKRKSGRVCDMDVAKSMIGLLCVGKPDYDAISEYRNEPFFSHSLALERLSSAETLHQRIQSWPEKTAEVWRGFTTRLLRKREKLVQETIHGKKWCVIHADVSPMDNSDTKKEGGSWTYKKFAGYSPIFAYIGPYGFMLNNQLSGIGPQQLQGKRPMVQPEPENGGFGHLGASPGRYRRRQ